MATRILAALAALTPAVASAYGEIVRARTVDPTEALDVEVFLPRGPVGRARRRPRAPRPLNPGGGSGGPGGPWRPAGR